MPSVFGAVSSKLRDLAALEEDPETEGEAIEINPSTLNDLSKFEAATRSEIHGTSPLGQ